MISRVLRDERDTVALAKQLAPFMSQLHIVYLRGELGTGKTTFVRALLRELGHRGAVKSPTYTIVEPYDIGGRPVYHLDLYRLADPEELEFLGFEDYLSPESLCLIEWPDKGDGMLPPPDLELMLTHREVGRGVEIQASPEMLSSLG